MEDTRYAGAIGKQVAFVEWVKPYKQKTGIVLNVRESKDRMYGKQFILTIEVDGENGRTVERFSPTSPTLNGDGSVVPGTGSPKHTRIEDAVLVADLSTTEGFGK